MSSATLAAMATCASCGAYLSEGHRCSGAWRRRRRSAIVGLVGALLGITAPYVLLGDRLHPSTVAIAMVLGILLALSLAKSVK